MSYNSTMSLIALCQTIYRCKDDVTRVRVRNPHRQNIIVEQNAADNCLLGMSSRMMSSSAKLSFFVTRIFEQNPAENCLMGV